MQIYSKSFLNKLSFFAESGEEQEEESEDPESKEGSGGGGEILAPESEDARNFKVNEDDMATFRKGGCVEQRILGQISLFTPATRTLENSQISLYSIYGFGSNNATIET